jgi:hypothetical protein
MLSALFGWLGSAGSSSGASLGLNPPPLPILEGGLMTVAVVGLVAGIRIIQRKNKR